MYVPAFEITSGGMTALSSSFETELVGSGSLSSITRWNGHAALFSDSQHRETAAPPAVTGQSL